MLQVGDVFGLTEGQSVYATVPQRFLFLNRQGVFDKTAKGQVLIGGNLAYLAGRYVVYETKLEGGGASPDGGFSDGHHVFAEQLDNPDVKVDFYQSGDFSAMLPDIVPLGTAVRKWVFYPVKNATLDGGETLSREQAIQELQRLRKSIEGEIRHAELNGHAMAPGQGVGPGEYVPAVRIDYLRSSLNPPRLAPEQRGRR
jgi:hypothetical protein